ncbi:MAG: hypothetical protein KGO53_14270 [Alphaproteobacteria bacterium]|nr:hypothetical protein [Alphaproteobacteria bacterium]
MMNRRHFLFASASLALLPAIARAQGGPLDLSARLFQVIDAMDVEHHWPAGVHIEWESGEPDGKPVSSEGKHTHCSAFVASVAKRLGIYVLRPPDHGQALLANAQFEWLLTDGQAEGWMQLADMAAAQDAANQGQLVLAAYHNHKDDKPGHIAIVRPGTKSSSQLAAEGPDITQAGLDNFRVTTVKKGFADHKSAFAGDEILYFAHAVDPAALASQ